MESGGRWNEELLQMGIVSFWGDKNGLKSVVWTVVQPLSCVRLFATPWTTAHQASLSFTVSQSLLKLMTIESVMPSNHLILCRPFLPLPLIFPNIRVNESKALLKNPTFQRNIQMVRCSEHVRTGGWIFTNQTHHVAGIQIKQLNIYQHASVRTLFKSCCFSQGKH